MASDAAPGAPTPPQEEQPNSAYAVYVPHDLKYDGDFEDAVMDVVLASASPPQQLPRDGIRVIPDDSSEEPVQGVSVRAQDISLQSLPVIREEELPLPLDDRRRIFASPVPGIRLTHPGGYLEGGPGLDPEMDTFPEDFLQNNAYTCISSISNLRAAVGKEIDASLELLRQRVQARRDAKERNERIEMDLKKMAEEHAMELKVNKKLNDERRAKKEAKERRRAEREAG
jgi:hypothetical protein